MKLTKAVFALIAMAALAGCVGRKNLNYLQDPALSNTAKLFPNQKFEYKIQVNDVLSIRVMGLDEANARFFNVDGGSGVMGMNEQALYVNGFGVDKFGFVQLPNVGKIKVQGLTVGEAQETIQKKISEYFTTATVIMKLVSFRVSVLGEVERPGSFFVYNSQINLLEALAQAGGPKEFADKRHVTLMRKSDQGTQALYVDLGRADIASSEYYYLLPNDVIYVPALKARPARLNFEPFTVLLSVVSTAALVFSIVQNQTK